MAITLTYLGATKVPIEIEGLTPDWAYDKSLAQIERFEIFHGNRPMAAAEMFRISGDPSDREMIFEGDLRGVHWIGAHTCSGRIRIQGSAGRHVGSQMQGGTILVEGDVGGWVGAEMRDGLIHVRGNAGHLAGAAYRGSAKGMTGGMLLIDGQAGNEVGLTMRRGLIAVGGAVGDMVGFNMIAGTIALFGDCGIRPGAGMRRGSIVMMGSNPPQLLPTFRYATTFASPSVRVLLNVLRQRGYAVNDACMDAEYSLFRGDFVALGRGEILLRG